MIIEKGEKKTSCVIESGSFLLYLVISFQKWLDHQDVTDKLAVFPCECHIDVTLGFNTVLQFDPGKCVVFVFRIGKCACTVAFKHKNNFLAFMNSMKFVKIFSFVKYHGFMKDSIG